ncbi:hypothetical protein C8J56DRAFT_165710 [Mycena floridula]|nr:hypothetical protein C8J56DRAFT_165710 [Mycena floridula]
MFFNNVAVAFFSHFAFTIQTRCRGDEQGLVGSKIRKGMKRRPMFSSNNEYYKKAQQLRPNPTPALAKRPLVIIDDKVRPCHRQPSSFPSPSNPRDTA